ncbi:MAG: hypothetical protein RIE03_18775 [Pseudomonadales bacterium]
MASEDEVGFPPGFSRNVEAILKIGSAGGFFSMEEFRENLRLAGLSLGADEYPAPPEFEVPQPPSESDEFPDEFDPDETEEAA